MADAKHLTERANSFGKFPLLEGVSRSNEGVPVCGANGGRCEASDREG
ncbi:MAG: hypothetical protein IKY78_00910 [Clostridia bacterium]|nr:hypothetical protein [Clostridia bacterium]